MSFTEPIKPYNYWIVKYNDSNSVICVLEETVILKEFTVYKIILEEFVGTYIDI